MDTTSKIVATIGRMIILTALVCALVFGIAVSICVFLGEC